MIVKEMQDAGRSYNERVVNSPEAERGRPHVWFFNAMVKTIVKILAHKKGRSNEDNQKTCREFELNAWRKACRQLPTNAKPGQPLKSRIIFAVE